MTRLVIGSHGTDRTRSRSVPFSSVLPSGCLRKQLVLLGCSMQPLAPLVSCRRGIFFYDGETRRQSPFCCNWTTQDREIPMTVYGQRRFFRLNQPFWQFLPKRPQFDLENEGWAWEKALSSKEAQSQLIVFREWGLAFGVGTSVRFPLLSLFPCLGGAIHQSTLGRSRNTFSCS